MTTFGFRCRALSEGHRFVKRFGTSLGDVFPNEIGRLLEIGLIEVTGDAIRLSERGRLLGNEVFAEFIGDE